MRVFSLWLLCLTMLTTARAGVVTRLPTDEPVVALTFDACQAGKRVMLDHAIADYLIAHEIPFTVFAGGKFARDNPDDMKLLASLPFVEIESHSWAHNNDMPALTDEKITDDLAQASAAIIEATGSASPPRLFRFPAGKTDERTTDLVESLGYRIVHWRYAVGDPDRNVSAKAIVRETLSRTQNGDILIFHINGRGVHTAEALPEVIEGLQAKGFRFVLLKDWLIRSSGPPP